MVIGTVRETERRAVGEDKGKRFIGHTNTYNAIDDGNVLRADALIFGGAINGGIRMGEFDYYSDW